VLFRSNTSFTPELNKEEIDIFYNRPERFLKGHNKCLVPWKSAQILANGDLTISTRCFNMKLGNINETSFKEAWNSKEMKRFRKALRKEGAFPACSRCCGLL
jgi:radical SAM protein with 4Fe4S-binding SPASM domain